MTPLDHEVEHLHMLEAVKLMIDEQAKRIQRDMSDINANLSAISNQLQQLNNRRADHA